MDDGGMMLSHYEDLNRKCPLTCGMNAPPQVLTVLFGMGACLMGV